ncbi:MAG: hypothetical protein E7488_05880 [Ruminococcaceae bacterium]|nr:hypothetical protein [Oscillospiraceae bacterium]
MAVILTKNDLIDKLKIQISRLQLHAKAFDDKKLFVTYDMATVIRVLFHDTNMSHSLIKQICDMEGKDKSNFEMFSSIKPPEPNTLILLGDGLYSMCFSPKGIECCPVLNASPHIKMDFDIWWNEKVVKNVSNGYENPSWMTRKELILGHVNQEGGAHVDGEVDDNIAKIGTEEAFGWISYIDDGKGNMTSPPAAVDQKQASIRQICYETLYALHKHFPECFEEMYF